ncbi:LAFE_0B09582g1_1 [Lachancea fermentati]|uniref:Kynurenine 3-monooxygenase n=1 Tax=Lachancea fermentati TaxID=4955 RepID=A0A1G4M8D6_LACFM|nr:LAFE_0B09582g1_1 [Lachancea fermentati]
MPESVAVIGAGLVGCLAAVALAKRNYDVTLFDYRHDPRLASTSDRNLRSINLAISARGITALQFVDRAMSERVLREIIPMRGRMIHDTLGHQEPQNYGLFGECINSIDRAVLNNSLLDELEAYPNIKLQFGHKLARIAFGARHQTCEFTTTSAAGPQSDARARFDFDFVVGCDGAYSTTRSQMQRVIRMDYAQEYIDCCYIELYIPPAKDVNPAYGGKFSISPNHLHIWPRHNYMLIALANADGSFTSTFFGPWSLVESLDSTSKIEAFFVENFPDAVDLIGLDEAVYAFENHPKGALMCVECKPYHVAGKAIILGDAAHSMVPFYGQGMNCGFEDVRVLMQILDQNHGNRARAFDEYTAQRHKDLVSIIELAKNNYKEMSHKVTSKWFLLRKKLDTILGRTLKDRWLPLYTMVSFRADIPYHKAIEVEKRQKRILVYLQAVVILATSVGGYGVFKALRKALRRLQ